MDRGWDILALRCESAVKRQYRQVQALSRVKCRMTNTMPDEMPAVGPQQLDVRGLACPLPLLKARKALREVVVGQTLEVLATDPGSWRDFAAFAEQSGHSLLEASEAQGMYRYVIKRCF